MNGRGYRAEALHGGMNQEQRDRVMGRLRSGAAELLVATDVAARGLDVDLLTHVVNYEVPSAPEAYVHRIGRVGRAGREGVAITLVEPREQRLLANIERLTKQKIDDREDPDGRRSAGPPDRDHPGHRARSASPPNDLDQFRPVLDALLADHPIEQVALAAVKLAHEASGATLDEVEIPDLTLRREERPEEAGPRDPRRVQGAATGRQHGQALRRRRAQRRVRPQDLVGAIANETSLSGKDIGAIRVSDHYSIVEIPDNAVDDVVASMARSMIKGKKATIRRYREEKRT